MVSEMLTATHLRGLLTAIIAILSCLFYMSIAGWCWYELFGRPHPIAAAWRSPLPLMRYWGSSSTVGAAV